MTIPSATALDACRDADSDPALDADLIMMLILVLMLVRILMACSLTRMFSSKPHIEM